MTSYWPGSQKGRWEQVMKEMKRPGVILKQEKVGHICRPVLGVGGVWGLKVLKSVELQQRHQPVSREL